MSLQQIEGRKRFQGTSPIAIDRVAEPHSPQTSVSNLQGDITCDSSHVKSSLCRLSWLAKVAVDIGLDSWTNYCLANFPSHSVSISPRQSFFCLYVSLFTFPPVSPPLPPYHFVYIEERKWRVVLVTVPGHFYCYLSHLLSLFALWVPSTKMASNGDNGTTGGWPWWLYHSSVIIVSFLSFLNETPFFLDYFLLNEWMNKCEAPM